jgi:hypothetical protein
MKANSVTFCGSLGELVASLRKAAHLGAGSRREVGKIFPETGRVIISGTSPESVREWKRRPDLRRALIESGRVRFFWLFFDAHIPELEGVLDALYPDAGPGLTISIEKCFRILSSSLREIRRRLRVSRSPENEYCREDFDKALLNFNDSLPPAFARWKIIEGNFGASTPAVEQRKFRFSLSIREVDKLIGEAEMMAAILHNRPMRRGRPPKPFNALLFHVVNTFTERCYTAKGNCVMIDGKIRVRKNWQLICAALLWLHVLYDVPEMRAFIRAHESEEAGAALSKFVSWAKKEYSHFQETGKGWGKLEFAHPGGLENLDIPLIYLNDEGEIRGFVI